MIKIDKNSESYRTLYYFCNKFCQNQLDKNILQEMIDLIEVNPFIKYENLKKELSLEYMDNCSFGCFIEYLIDEGIIDEEDGRPKLVDTKSEKKEVDVNKPNICDQPVLGSELKEAILDCLRESCKYQTEQEIIEYLLNGFKYKSCKIDLLVKSCLSDLLRDSSLIVVSNYDGVSKCKYVVEVEDKIFDFIKESYPCNVSFDFIIDKYDTSVYETGYVLQRLINEEKIVGVNEKHYQYCGDKIIVNDKPTIKDRILRLFTKNPDSVFSSIDVYRSFSVCSLSVKGIKFLLDSYVDQKILKFDSDYTNLYRLNNRRVEKLEKENKIDQYSIETLFVMTESILRCFKDDKYKDQRIRTATIRDYVKQVGNVDMNAFDVAMSVLEEKNLLESICGFDVYTSVYNKIEQKILNIFNSYEYKGKSLHFLEFSIQKSLNIYTRDQVEFVLKHLVKNGILRYSAVTNNYSCISSEEVRKAVTSFVNKFEYVGKQKHSCLFPLEKEQFEYYIKEQKFIGTNENFYKGIALKDKKQEISACKPNFRCKVCGSETGCMHPRDKQVSNCSKKGKVKWVMT
jgi:hypothetical protein